jgi:hypothetical protein
MVDLKDKLIEQLPALFNRKTIERLLPGLISAKTLANMHSLGIGPPAFHRGRLVIYFREDFVEWLLTSRRLTKINDNRNQEN